MVLVAGSGLYGRREDGQRGAHQRSCCRLELHGNMRAGSELTASFRALRGDHKRAAMLAWCADLAQAAVAFRQCASRGRERITSQSRYNASDLLEFALCRFMTRSFARFTNFTFLRGARGGFLGRAFFFFLLFSFAFCFELRSFFGSAFRAFNDPLFLFVFVRSASPTAFGVANGRRRARREHQGVAPSRAVRVGRGNHKVVGVVPFQGSQFDTHHLFQLAALDCALANPFAR